MVRWGGEEGMTLRYCAFFKIVAKSVLFDIQLNEWLRVWIEGLQVAAPRVDSGG